MHNSWPFFWGPSVLLSASLYLSLKGNVRLGTVPLWGFHILSWSSRRHAAQEDKWPSEAAGPWIPTAGQGQTPTGKKPNWESGGEGCPPWHSGSEPTRVRRGQPSPPSPETPPSALAATGGSAAAWAGSSLLLAEENHDTSSEKTFMRWWHVFN